MFSLATAAAAIVLVYFAWREADQERLVWEQGQRQRLEQAADLVAEKTLSTLSDLLSRLSRQYHPGVRTQEDPSSVDRATIAELFVIRPDGEVTFPLFRPPFRLRSSGAGIASGASEEKTDKFRSAELLEFGGKDFPAAVQAYRAVRSSAVTRSQRGWAINAMARALTKAGRSNEALMAYRDLVRELGAERSEDGIPLGIIGGFASAQVMESAGTFEDAADSLLDLSERLISGEYELDKSQFTYFFGEAGDRFSTIVVRLEAGSSRRALENRHEALLKVGGDILARAEWAELISMNPGLYRKDQLSFAILPARPTPYLVGSVPLSGGLAYGAVFDPGQIAARLIPEIARSPALGDGLQVSLEAGTPPALSKSAPVHGGLDARLISFERSLAPDLTSWTIRVRLDRPMGTVPGFGSRRALYVAAALLLAGAVFIGGLVTIHGLAREMELIRLKTDFVATVSHELRTPLTSIRYISDLLRDGRVVEEDRRSQYYETLHQESARLGRIIENILDFSKIEAGLKEYRFVRTDAGPFTADIAARFSEVIALKGFRLKTSVASPLPAVAMDAEALGRALFNLLDNAAKYSGESRELEIRVSSDLRNVRWEIVDHGTGIPEEDLGRIFERFFRSRRDALADVKGSGIGLTITKHIVEAHGGTISVASEIGRGSTFTVMIPAESAVGDGLPPSGGQL